ncbi:uncharacterized protein LAESUDRAFT_751702 [Laetiporus sulphureus 93-53]|uniref:Uncharacterized protein n=1 Tax=Laetiporus sulphureus 93-53 TaxID=1314785 RepID=A0A165CR32_9APHY|nr:uncharacterized protein LAESUDRAFT_751702 [Laetiporus sulphureus 93-53]KZT03272.1 hypothetical protein LAESUDRAFT_751702 [Laetiporus sulphureus 93-53]
MGELESLREVFEKLEVREQKKNASQELAIGDSEKPSKPARGDVAMDVDRAKSRPQSSLVHRIKRGQAIRYPRLPKGFRSHPCHYVLGWEVSDATVRSYIKRLPHYIDVFIYKHEKALLDTHGLMLLLLKRIFCYEHFFWATVLPRGSRVPEDPFDPKVPFVTVFGICATASKRYFRRRPSKMQYAALMNAFGAVPAKWHKDPLPKSLFHLQAVCMDC